MIGEKCVYKIKTKKVVEVVCSLKITLCGQILRLSTIISNKSGLFCLLIMFLLDADHPCTSAGSAKCLLIIGLLTETKLKFYDEKIYQQFLNPTFQRFITKLLANLCTKTYIL